MPIHEEDNGFQPIGPIQPVNRIYAMRALRIQQTRSYMGDRKRHFAATNSDNHEESDMPTNPAVILDISPQAREQAHHLAEQAPDCRPQAIDAGLKPTLNEPLASV